jgi:hypothetical protein
MAARRATVALAMTLIGLATAAIPGSPGTVSAATFWSLGLSTTVLTEGVATNVTVTVTDGIQAIGCIELNLPAGFTVVGTSVSRLPPGFVWGSAGGGSGPTQVVFSTTQDKWRLNGGATGVFIVRVVALANPLAAWKASAYEKFDVDPPELVRGPLAQPEPFRIATTLTPSPELTPNATPAATQVPTPEATPPATHIPTPEATPPATHIPTPNTLASPSPSDSIAPSEAPSALASSGVVSGGGAETGSTGFGGTVGGGGGGIQLEIGAPTSGGSVQVDSQAVGAIGMFVWLVPGLFLSLPGMLLLMILLAQASFATAFVPVTRRVLGAGRQLRARDRCIGT